MKKLLLITLAPLLTFASTPLEVKFLSDEDSNNGTVTLKVTNTSKQDIEILKWNTPFEKTLSADIFNINMKKQNNSYIGRAVKRAKPQESDYMLLESGVSQSIKINLSKYYEMKRKGSYSVEFDGTFNYRLLDETEVKKAKIIKEELPKIKLFFVPTLRQKRANALKQTAKFKGCSQKDITVLNVAHDDAIKMSKEASTAMNKAGKKTSAKRYTTWFGKADSKRQKKVTDGFTKIYDVFENKDISFDCGTCKNDKDMYASTYAYVYPNAQYEVYLCGAFWNSSRTGTDTQAGTLIHEVSHFSVVAGTNDYAYGQADAQKLAKESPEKAVNNAENYDYFAENNPQLSMDNPNSDEQDNEEENSEEPSSNENNNSDTQEPTEFDDNYDTTQEDEDWNKCLELESDDKIESCFVVWEDKYYPMDEDFNWDDENWSEDDELNWNDIDWGYGMNLQKVMLK